MTDFSWLDAGASAQWFGAGTHHEPVQLRHLPDARLLWLNRQAAEADPQFTGDVDAYERHLLASCAYVVADGDAAAAGAAVTGYADRYGGAGIGSNGGSGRAAVVNGYHVKGIGRTRLVSALTGPAHASGGAYLEESVRETIYGEIVRAEFPHSAVPVLAIIDTGLVQQWNLGFGPPAERRTLVVRPCFVRPAHFVRATGFISDDPREGSRDTQRVQAMFAQASAALGRQGLARAYETLWRNWARQMAYAFVHRLPHGSNTVSNICFDGKLLDFGAMSAVPSWANTATMVARHSFSAQANLLPGLIAGAGYFFGRFFHARYGEQNEQSRLAATAHAAFRQTVMVEGLRLCGVPRGAAQAAVDGPLQGQIWRCLYAVICHFQRELIDMTVSTPALRLSWDLPQIWDAEPAPHLQPLRDLVLPLVAPSDRRAAARRSAFLCAPREHLFREDAKPVIYAAIDPSQRNAPPERQQIERYINEQVAKGRRDHQLPTAEGDPAGFAVGNEAVYVLFRERGSDRMVAVKETQRGSRPRRHIVQRAAADLLVFDDATVPEFSGHVHLHAEGRTH